MDCPVHAFVIRSSSPHDLLFIENDENYTAEERAVMVRQMKGFLNGV